MPWLTPPKQLFIDSGVTGTPTPLACTLGQLFLAQEPEGLVLFRPEVPNREPLRPSWRRRHCRKSVTAFREGSGPDVAAHMPVASLSLALRSGSVSAAGGEADEHHACHRWVSLTLPSPASCSGGLGAGS